jgi:hypothetical protein
LKVLGIHPELAAEMAQIPVKEQDATKACFLLEQPSHKNCLEMLVKVVDVWLLCNFKCP